MQFGNVKVPWRLVDALDQERLVVFVGAGVSVDPPSSLPLFPKLTADIAEGSINRGEHEPLERFLGRLEDDAGIDIHRRAARLLAPPESRPNELHRLILRLFRSPDRIRVVTTNFDLHLEAALPECFPDSNDTCEIFKAPALPTGDDFRGIAYLHGCLDPDPGRMVLTDKDFGRAYLTEGWARRFLMRLFQSHHVLFVGYRHSDEILNYLARGLPPGNRGERAAITGDGEAGRWGLLGIQPLEYPSGAHVEVRMALEEWVRHRSLEAQDRETEIRAIVSRPVELLAPHERDRLLWAIRSEKYQHFFFHNADSEAWLEWGERNDLLSPLFDPESEDQELRMWFVREPLSKRGARAIEILCRNIEKKICYPSWRQLSFSIWAQVRNGGTLSEDQGRLLTRWLALLRYHGEPGWDWGALERLLGALGSSRARLIIELLEILTEPILLPLGHRAVFGPVTGLSFRMGRGVSIAWRAWSETIRPDMDRFAVPILNLVQRQLDRSHHLLREAGKATERSDPLSFYRITVEESDQTRISTGPVDLLLAMGREALVWLSIHRPGKGRAVIESWLECDGALLQRVALHAAASHPKLSAIQQAKYLLSDHRLEDHQLHHEVFGVLREAYPRLNTTWRKRVIAKKSYLLDEHLKEGILDEKRLRKRAREWFTFLAWLRRADPDCLLVREELDQVHHQFPEFRESDRPDLKHYVERIEYEQPDNLFSVEELVELEPRELLGRYEDAVRADGGDLRDQLDALKATVKEAAGKDFEWSLSLSRYLLSGDGVVDTDRAQEIERLVIGGWQEVQLSSDQWRCALGLFSGAELSNGTARDLSILLKHRFDAEDDELNCDDIEDAGRFAAELQPRIRGLETVAKSPDDPLLEAVNHPCGALAQFAVSALSCGRKLNCYSSRDLPQLWALLEALVKDAEGGAVHGAVVLVSQLHFMLWVNQEWTVRRLFPLMRWESSDGLCSRSVWAGFFFWGRLSPLVREHLPSLLSHLFPHLEELPARVRPRASRYVAEMVFGAEGSLLEESWFSDYLRFSRDEDRASFVEEIQQILQATSERGEGRAAAEDSHWERVLARYLDLRLTEADIGDGEWSAVAGWCLHLGEAVPQFIERYIRGPVPHDQRIGIFSHLPDSGLVGQYPNEVAVLVAYLLGGQRRGEFWHMDSILAIVDQLREAKAAPERIDRVKNKALELGASGSMFAE
jgi:hypothetical protein